MDIKHLFEDSSFWRNASDNFFSDFCHPCKLLINFERFLNETSVKYSVIKKEKFGKN